MKLTLPFLPLPTAAAVAVCICVPATASAAITLDFEGAGGYVNAIGEFYNGGTDCLGRAGTNYGVSFSNAAVALSNDADFTFYSHAPSAGTVMFAFDSSAVMNVAAGFTGGLSFYYSSAHNVLNAVGIWSGLNGTGALLASASLFGNAQVGCSDSAYCRFDLTSVQFAGIGRSVRFGGDAPNVAYDNITLAISAVPEPSTWLLLAGGLLGVALLKRRAG